MSLNKEFVSRRDNSPLALAKMIGNQADRIKRGPLKPGALYPLAQGAKIDYLFSSTATGRLVELFEDDFYLVLTNLHGYNGDHFSWNFNIPILGDNRSITYRAIHNDETTRRTVYELHHTFDVEGELSHNAIYLRRRELEDDKLLAKPQKSSFDYELRDYITMYSRGKI